MKRPVWTSARKREGNGTLARPRRSGIAKECGSSEPQQLDSLEDVERAHVQRILAESSKLTVAAARLGIDLTTLWRKRKRWGLA